MEEDTDSLPNRRFGFQSWTVKKLRTALAGNILETTGNKEDVIDRLIQDTEHGNQPGNGTHSGSDRETFDTGYSCEDEKSHDGNDMIKRGDEKDERITRRNLYNEDKQPKRTRTIEGNFIKCSLRFAEESNGDVESFIDEIITYKECENISDDNAIKGKRTMLERKAALW